MKHLSIETLPASGEYPKLSIPHAAIFNLPEKVLQFGTGVLLRGLPDYYIDKANKQGIFNGRVVVVKSTTHGSADAFDRQNNLYTHCIRGIENGKNVEEDIVNASISRVLNANADWQQVLNCAADPAIEIIISNTTEVGISLQKDDKLTGTPPASFPGKLLACLYRRYQALNGDMKKGMVIVPTELLVGNGEKLRSIVVELAQLNAVDDAFMNWLEQANHFCSSLVDRIVPGKPADTEQSELTERYQYTDELTIMSEPYGLWAIEAADEIVKEKLSFYKADEGVVIVPDIDKFRELKLRLLNGAHTFTCGLAFLAGYITVKQAMEAPLIAAYVRQLMQNEIVPAIVDDQLLTGEAINFANSVIDRFGNPFIQHQWLSISMQYSSKMKTRNTPTLLKYYEKNMEVPQLMALGFAAYISFMNVVYNNQSYVGNLNNRVYPVIDERSSWFAAIYQQKQGANLVHEVLSDQAFWEVNLEMLPGFTNAVTSYFNLVQQGKILALLQSTLHQQHEV